MKDLKLPASTGSGNHPSPETLFEAAAGGGDAVTRAEIQRHAALCSECSAELAHLEAFRGPIPMRRSALEAAWRGFRMGQAGLQTGRKGRVARRSPVWVLAAAAAVFAVGLAIPVLERTFRAAAPPEIERGASERLELQSPRGALEAPPAEFVFRGPSRPVRVTVFDVPKSFAWTSDPVAGGRVAFPVVERHRLEAGREYLWTLLGTQSPAPVASFRITPGAAAR